MGASQRDVVKAAAEAFKGQSPAALEEFQARARCRCDSQPQAQGGTSAAVGAMQGAEQGKAVFDCGRSAYLAGWVGPRR